MAVWTVIEPVVKQWANTVIANGGTGVLILVLGVGVIGWAAGKTQNEGGHGGKPHGGGGTSQQAGGSHGNPGAEYTYATGADPPPQSHGGPPPYANGGPPPHANGGPPPHANTSSNPGASSNSKPQWQPPPKPSAGWEKAREEMRKKEEERKKREEADKKAKEAAEKAKWDQARQREREQREKEARERVAQERVKREKELRERIEREAREAREKQDREAKEARERKEREAKEKEDKERAERLRNVSEKQAPGGLSNYRKPTASSFVSGEDINSSYYRSARRPQKTSSQSSFVSDSSSYLSGTGSQSTARTTPPPSHRGPYVNKDPDKVSIKAVFLFSDTLPGKPLAQLRSGMGSVTDGLVLKMTTEGLFIDDDVRGVGQREWDVKAWTMKLVEVSFPPSIEYLLFVWAGLQLAKPDATQASTRMMKTC